MNAYDHFDNDPRVHLATVTTARVLAEGAERDLRLSVVIAHDAGVPVTELAEAAGVSRPTIYRWLERRDS